MIHPFDKACVRAVTIWSHQVAKQEDSSSNKQVDVYVFVPLLNPSCVAGLHVKQTADATAVSQVASQGDTERVSVQLQQT